VLSTFETTDIFRGAFFLSKGARLSGAYLTEDGRQIVSFRIIGENLEVLDESYRLGKASVDPLRLRESLNHLRDVLFQTLRENERNKKRRHAHADNQARNRHRQAVS
jgi:hypothetical protein